MPALPANSTALSSSGIYPATCRANLAIVVSYEPQDVLDYVRKHAPVLLGYHYPDQTQRIATVRYQIQAYRDLPAYCRTRGLGYVYFTSDDPGREVGDDDREKIGAAVQANHELVPLFKAGIGTVYKVASP